MSKNEFKLYRKKGLQPMRPYIPGENMDGISVSEDDKLEAGGMIAQSLSDSADQWYVSKSFFLDNYELAQGGDAE